MVHEMVPAHVVFPKELIEAADRLVGRRKRSAFVAEAVEDKVERERLGCARKRTAGFLAPGAHPEWDTPESVSAWVRELRAVDDDATERKLARRQER
jgi:hypothetical protein